MASTEVSSPPMSPQAHPRSPEVGEAVKEKIAGVATQPNSTAEARMIPDGMFGIQREKRLEAGRGMLPAAEKEVKSAQEMMDADGDGVITFAEYKEYAKIHQRALLERKPKRKKKKKKNQYSEVNSMIDHKWEDNGAFIPKIKYSEQQKAVAHTYTGKATIDTHWDRDNGGTPLTRKRDGRPIPSQKLYGHNWSEFQKVGFHAVKDFSTDSDKLEDLSPGMGNLPYEKTVLKHIPGRYEKVPEIDYLRNWPRTKLVSEKMRNGPDDWGSHTKKTYPGHDSKPNMMKKALDIPDHNPGILDASALGKLEYTRQTYQYPRGDLCRAQNFPSVQRTQDKYISPRDWKILHPEEVPERKRDAVLKALIAMRKVEAIEAAKTQATHSTEEAIELPSDQKREGTIFLTQDPNQDEVDGGDGSNDVIGTTVPDDGNAVVENAEIVTKKMKSKSASVTSNKREKSMPGSAVSTKSKASSKSKPRSAALKTLAVAKEAKIVPHEYAKVGSGQHEYEQNARMHSFYKESELKELQKYTHFSEMPIDLKRPWQGNMGTWKNRGSVNKPPSLQAKTKGGYDAATVVARRTAKIAKDNIARADMMSFGLDVSHMHQSLIAEDHAFKSSKFVLQTKQWDTLQCQYMLNLLVQCEDRKLHALDDMLHDMKASGTKTVGISNPNFGWRDPKEERNRAERIASIGNVGTIGKNLDMAEQLRRKMHDCRERVGDIREAIMFTNRLGWQDDIRSTKVSGSQGVLLERFLEDTEGITNDHKWMEDDIPYEGALDRPY